ncbi:MAG: tetratricopeptide repeat protein [Bacteroidota bacterium]
MSSTFTAYYPCRSYHWALILLGCLIYGFLPAQNPIVDSLQRVIADTRDESTRLKASNQLALALMKTDPDSAMQLIRKTIPNVEVLGDQDLLFEVFYTKGRIYEIRQQLDSALMTFGTARDLAASSNNQKSVAYCYIQMGYVYHTKNESQKGLSLLKEALAVAEESEEELMEVMAANAIGRIYSFLSEFDSSNIYLNRALTINKKRGDKYVMAQLYTNIANNYVRASEMDKAIEYFLLSQGLMRDLNDIPGVSTTFRNIGVTHFIDGNYPKALEYLHEALNTVEGTEHQADIIQNLDYLGEIYLTIKDFDNALLYWEKAGEAYQVAYDDQKNPNFLFNRGRTHLAKNEYAAAIELLLEAKERRDEMGQFIGGDLYWNLGQAHEKLSDYDAAEENYVKALELSQNQNTNLIKLKSLYGLGITAEQRANVTRARGYFQESYDLAKKSGLKENEMEAAKGLYRVYKKQNDAVRSLQFLEISTNIQDSLYNEESTRNIAKLEAGFVFEKEKQELEFAQQSELDREANVRNMLWAALAMAGLILAVGLFYFRSKQKANAELSRLNEELSAQKVVVEKQKEKLEELDEAKSRFFTNISHEFRTPLTIISGMASQVINNPQDWARRGGEMIKQSSGNLLNLVNQILDLRKLEANKLKVEMVNGNVVDYLRYIMESHHSFAAQKGIQIHFLKEGEDTIMDYDPDKLLRIVSNLLSNAIKFTSSGENIYLRTEEIFVDGNPAFSLQVQDTGVGIPEDQLPHVFGRFYQVDDSATRKGEGTGIGLALTYELVQLMGGQIDVQSKVGKGTTFKVVLPITQTATASSSLPSFTNKDTRVELIGTTGLQSVQPLVRNEEAISDDLPQLLIVEDNPQIVQILVACLEKEFQLEIADNGQAGIDKALEQVPDIIISDVMMPGKNGYELTNTLKTDERTDHIPIVLLTAKSDLDSRVSGIEQGADAYLAKPFEQKELLAQLRNLLEIRKKLQARYGKYAAFESETPKVEDPFMEKFYSLIEQEIANAELDMKLLTKTLGMSRSHIHRKLKALTGQSPTILIRNHRLQKGKQLLDTTDLTVSEVAYDVGFTSLSYFSNAYFEEFGERPSATRK